MTTTVTRRTVLKGAGVGAGVWAAPTLLSIGSKAAASSASPCVHVTGPFSRNDVPPGGTAFTATVTVRWSGSGPVLLAADCGGDSATNVDDEIHVSGPNGTYSNEYADAQCSADHPLPPTDISSILNPGQNSVTVTITNSTQCGGPSGAITDIYIVAT